MRKFSRGELKHLKWKLINKDGLSVAEADKRINELISFEKNLDIEKKQKPKKTLKQKLDEDIIKLKQTETTKYIK